MKVGQGQHLLEDKVLAEVGRRLRAGGPLDVQAEVVAEVLAEAGSTVAVRHWDKGQLVTLAAMGPQAASVMMPEPEPLGELLKTGDVLVLQPLADHPHLNGQESWLRLLLAAGLQAAALVPLLDRDEPWGVLSIYLPQPERSAVALAARGQLLAELLSLRLTDDPAALEQARLEAGECYREAVIALHLDRDLNDICRRGVQSVRDVLAPHWVMIAALLGPEVFDCHLNGDRFQLRRRDSPLLCQVLESHEPIETLGQQRMGDLLAEPMRALGIMTTLSIPLEFKGETFGVLQVGHRESERLTAVVRHRAEQLGFHIALAMRDAGLLQAQETALTRLRQAQQEATQGAKFRALAQMAGGVAHEFNNALGGILARAQMLQRQTEDRRILAGLSTISEIGWRAAETVRRLQEFTRERAEEDFEPIATAQLWRLLADYVRQQAADFSRSSGVRYHVELEAGELDGVVLVNADELLGAVGNVVTNALEATPGGGVVMLRGNLGDGSLELMIADRGRGMTADELQSCFDPFFSTKAETGVGLGLSVTYGIVSRHRGEIEIESTMENGTTARITLPLCGERTEPVPNDVPHVLVIDDEAALCEVLSELFRSAGYTVDTCAGGREGIERFQATGYDLVCTDLRTEDLSGWEVIRAVKESGRGTPVMLLTGFREQLRPEQIEESGVDAVLGKPFTLQQVLEASRRLLHPEDA